MMLINHNIKSATSIDYTNEAEIYCYQILMCKIFEYENGLCGSFRMNSIMREVQFQGRIWLKNVKSIIDAIVSGNSTSFSLAAIPKLLTAYEFYYHICNGRPVNEYLRSIRLKTVMLWVKGDKSISDTSLILELLKESCRDNTTLDKRLSTFAFGALGDWIRELRYDGKFSNISMAESYARLSFLISDDLFAYLGSKEQSFEKDRWIKTYQLSDEVLDTLDADTLMAYMGFAQSALLYLRKFDELKSNYLHLLSKLIVHTDLNHFLKQSITLELLS